MPWFEVFIPAKDDSAMNVTLTVDAPNWIGALRTGLSNIGEGQEAISNVMCDIKEDNSIHVTNPNTGRVFRLVETTAPAEAPPSSEPAATQKMAPAPGPKSSAPAASSATEVEVDLDEDVVEATEVDAPLEKSLAPPPKRETGQFVDAQAPRRRKESKPTGAEPTIGRTDIPDVDVSDAIADVFDETQELQMEQAIDPAQVAERMLDLAMKNTAAESGTFYLADINSRELTFQAVRGPKADAIKKSKMTVPVGQGIVGFCAQEGVCLVIEEMQNDARYFSNIADAIGYVPKNTLCASAEKDGRLYGAIQLINSKRDRFTANEMEVVRYIGLAAADMLERAAEQA